MFKNFFKFFINLFDFKHCTNCGSFYLNDTQIICFHCEQYLKLLYRISPKSYCTPYLKIYPKYTWNRENHYLIGPYIRLLKESKETPIIQNLLFPHSFTNSSKKPIIWIPIPSLKNTLLTPLMAQALADKYGGEVKNILALYPNTQAQKTLKKSQRRNRKFYLTSLEFKTDPAYYYIFVDDIVTTGSTVIRAGLFLNIQRPSVVCFAYRSKAS